MRRVTCNVVDAGNHLPTRKHIRTAAGRHRATTDRIADTTELQVVAVDRSATGRQHPVVTGLATAVRRPGIALPMGRNAINEDVA